MRRAPHQGRQVLYVVQGGPQVPGPVAGDHGALTGLADDDHTQYHNDARGDARYSQLGHNHAGVYDPAGTAAAAIVAHEGAVDPHPGYLTAAEGAAAFAALANGVTNGDSHNHDGGDGAQIAYSSLSGKPTAKRTIGIVFDGGGSTPTPGTVGYVVSQFAGVIDRWDIIGDVSGSAVVDVWKAAGAIPTDANRIAGTEKLTLSAQQLASDAALSSWTTTVSVGDVLAFELESVATCTRITAQVRIAETL